MTSADRDKLLAAIDLGELLEELSGIERQGHKYPCPVPTHEQTGRTPPVGLKSDRRGYEVWNCHGCSAGGTAIDAVMCADGLSVQEAFAQLAERSGQHRGTRSSRQVNRRPPAAPSPAPPGEDELKRLRRAMTPDVEERLRALRGWSPEALRSLSIGYEGQRVTLPVRDGAGTVVGVLKYQPDPARRADAPKMLTSKGTPREMFPRPEDVPGAVLYLAEGEPDAVTLRSLGLAGVGLPGAGKRDPSWWPRLGRQRDRVVIIADSDDRGRQLAADAARAISPHCHDVRVVDLAPERSDGYDLTALLLEARQGSEDTAGDQVRALLEATAEQTAPWAAAALAAPEAAAVKTATTASFFDGTTFLSPNMGEHLRDGFPTATGGRVLYAFIDGIYRPADDALRREMIRLLGVRWKPRYADDTVAFLMQSSDRLWDSPPGDRVAVRNGILTLATRTLAPASADFRSPVQVAARFDPTATCPAIDRFLGQVFPDGVELLHEVVGHLMVPENRQRAFMFLGPGGNGKSTVLRLIRAFLGVENVSAVSLHDLEDNRFATADLFGKLVNIYADLDARALASTGIFKSITGGDPVRAERKNQNPFTFVPYARLVFSANEPPPTSDSSHAFFDRWIIVPFRERLRGSAQERDQDALLRDLTSAAELSGLLNHALSGLARLRRTGQFTMTTATQLASTEFRASADSVAAFLAEECRLGVGARIARAALWSAYRRWCEENNRRALSAQRFHRRVRELIPDLAEVKLTGVRTYDGVELEQS